MERWWETETAHKPSFCQVLVCQIKGNIFKKQSWIQEKEGKSSSVKNEAGTQNQNCEWKSCGPKESYWFPECRTSKGWTKWKQETRSMWGADPATPNSAEITERVSRKSLPIGKGDDKVALRRVTQEIKKQGWALCSLGPNGPPLWSENPRLIRLI